MSTADDRKRAAAEQAVSGHVRSGMRLGLGTGSTARHVLDVLAEGLAAGALHDVVGVPTSEDTRRRAGALGIPLATLAQEPALDVAIDGADEIAPDLGLIKGLGGALLRERIVASAARLFVVVADESKRVARLGERTPVPVEVIGLALPLAVPRLAALGCDPVLRRDGAGAPFVTDEGNRIVDCRFGPLDDPAGTGAAIRAVIGVVDHGLFLGIAGVAYVAGAEGVEVMAGSR